MPVTNLIASPEFWVATGVVLTYQASKFSELSSVDPSLIDRVHVIPRLRASDFADRKEFLGGLAAFLFASLVGFSILCVAPTSVLQGLLVLLHADPTIIPDIKDYPSTPVYIAAFYVGLSQPGVPVFSKIGDAQRDVFHYWIGIPKRVIVISNGFAVEMFSNADTLSALRILVDKLRSDRWIASVDGFADLVFYKDQLKLIKFDENNDARTTVQQTAHAKDIIEQLVFAAAIATVREKGGRGLPQLAESLGVKAPAQPSQIDYIMFIPEFMLLLICSIFVWFLIPQCSGIVNQIFGIANQNDSFWPYELNFALRSVFTHMVPVFLAVTLAIHLRPAASLQVGEFQWTQLDQHFVRHAPILMSILLFVAAYGCIRGFSDVGEAAKNLANVSPVSDTFFVFIGKSVLIYLLQSLVSILVCFGVLVYFSDGNIVRRRRVLWQWLAVVTLSAGVLSAFYAKAYLYIAFPARYAPEYLLLVVGLNISAVLISIVVASLYYRDKTWDRNLDTSHDSNLSGLIAKL